MENEPKREWTTKKRAQEYLEDVRGAIPGAELQLAVMGKIAQQWCSHPTRILDLGCGNGILGRFLFDLFPSVSCVFVDFSDPMLDAARNNVGTLAHATFIKADFGNPRWLENMELQDPFDMVVSGFAIHHQPDERKRSLYGEIYNLLTPGGVFLNLEHVASTTRAGQHLFDEFFVDHLYEFHSKSNPHANRKTIAHDYYKRSDKKENILACVVEQCQLLKDIGFTDVDCFFKVFELALFGGRKTSNQPNE